MFQSKHRTVFKKEIIENLEIKDGGTYVDLTLGGGGHFLPIFEELQEGILIGFDIDTVAISNLKERINPNSEAWKEPVVGVFKSSKERVEIILINRNFSRLEESLTELKIKGVDGIIADLGWSTDQLDRIPGLSHQKNESLDMRFDKDLGLQAKDILNLASRAQLKEIFIEAADIKGKVLNDLVNVITGKRKKKAFEAVSDLLQVVESVLPSAIHHGAYNCGRNEKVGDLPARVFQALRIVVNKELSTLQSLLPQAWNSLVAGGSLQVITFHSGEEKIVRQQFSTWISEGKAENLFDKNYLRPSVSELRKNIRARSAKLFAIVRK